MARGEVPGEQPGQAVFPRVPGLLFCTASSSPHTLQRQKRTALPKKTLAGSAGRQQEEAHPQHSHTLSQLSSLDPLSNARTLPSLPCPASHPCLHRESIELLWYRPGFMDVARSSSSNPQPPSISLPHLLSPPLITPLAKGKPFHGQGCSTYPKDIQRQETLK